MNKNKNNGNLSPILETQNLADLQAKAGNLYEAIAVISKRANQISAQIKEELHGKLEEFAVTSDNLEEIHENREQIEISKAYERLPNPSLQATEEFLEGKIYFRNPAKETESE
ncbi:MAG: DNA-directed RNA polymerase subunit omega [Chitinophagales bacterium]|jgi:DNA-directed RNA polymerase subunit K/omega